MKSGILVALIIIGGVVCGEVLSCDSCGRECASACGTRQFRTCCFNYLRKRTAPLETMSVDPSLRLELWLARSHNIRNVAPVPIAGNPNEPFDDGDGFRNGNDFKKDKNDFVGRSAM